MRSHKEEKELREARARIDYLEKCLAYLCECNAATVSHDAALKATSKSRKERYINIAKLSLQMLEGDWAPRFRPFSTSEFEQAKRHLKEVIKDL